MIEYGIPSDYIGKVHGKSKEWGKPITISTWQTLKNNHEKLMVYDCVVVDECVDGNTKIKTHNGYKKIEDIKIGDTVISYNEQRNTFEDDIVEEKYENMILSDNEDMYEIEMVDRSIIKITGNHKVLTDNGWKKVKKLKIGENIISYK
jgi:hypothetical protein